jgi:hypothetical protein
MKVASLLPLPLPVFVYKHNQILLVPSMALTTLSICVLLTFLPQLTPIWSAMASRSWV